MVAEASEKNEAVVAELRRTVQELKQKGEALWQKLDRYL